MTTGVLWYPAETTEESVEAKYPNLSEKIKESILCAAIIGYDKTLIRMNIDYAKMYGTIKRVLNHIVKDRVERSPDYQDAMDHNDPCKLWQIVVMAVGMQVALLDQEDAGHTVKLLYQAEKMTQHDTLLGFYHRLKLHYDNCILLKVKDIPDAEGVVRDFYSKLDPSRYDALYRDKQNNVKRKIETWPKTFQAAYDEIEAWIPQSYRGMDRNPGRPTVFMAEARRNNDLTLPQKC
jgi:hypothetical protein